MFILLQLPFVDLRGLHDGARGRSPRPDWRADDPSECFVRNFGGMSTRNARAFGLVGERAYVEFDKALIVPSPGGEHQQQGWEQPVPLKLWFRRLYFDGDISGRFEIGFRTDREAELQLFRRQKEVAYDLAQLGRTVCDLPVEVRSCDGTRTQVTLEKCGEALGLAYLAATTLHSKQHEYPPSELLGEVFKVGSASLHVRASNDGSVVIPADRRDIDTSNGGQMFLTSVAKARRRNTMTVQISQQAETESSAERAKRVLFSHLNSVLFANDFLSSAMDAKAIASNKIGLRELTERALDRFSKLVVSAPKTTNEVEFVEALKLFALEHAGRIDEAVAKLEEIKEDASDPSRLEKISGWAREWTEFALGKAIEASIATSMLGR